MTASYKEFISQDSQGQMEKPGALAEKWGIILIVMKGSKESPGRTLSDWEQAESGDDDYVWALVCPYNDSHWRMMPASSVFLVILVQVA